MICTRSKINGVGNGSLNTKLQVFDGNNWNQWMIQVCVLFGAQDVLDLFNDGYMLIGTDYQKHKELHRRKQGRRILRHCFTSISVWMCVCV